MTPGKSERKAAPSQSRQSVRVTLAWDGRALSVRRLTRVAMIAPGAVGSPPAEGHAGFWIELRDRKGRVRYHRVLHRPIATHVEVFSPERIEALPIAPEPTEFDVIVPDLDDAGELVVWSSPLAFDMALEPARVMGRFDLKSGGRGEGRDDERI